MRRHLLERRLSHADVDFLGELKVSALLGLLEQAAIEASTECGFDATRYTRDGQTWIIRRTRLERLIPVGGGDVVNVETQVADFRRARSLRRYLVRRGDVLVARGSTDWVYWDLERRRPTRIPEELRQALTEGDELPALPRAKPLPQSGAGAARELALAVYPSHLDHLVHVNNAIYANYLEDGAFEQLAALGWPLERMLAKGGALRLHWLDAEYFNDAFAGESLLVRSWLDDLGNTDDDPPRQARFVQAITRSSQDELLRAESLWRWQRRPSVLGGVPEI